MSGGAVNTSPLGTAHFRDPEEVASYHAFEPGDFWIGRCPFTNAPLGHSDDRHALLVSGTREGKGTGVIIPNLCLWPGSAIVIDPKGENATITAARRGDGSEYAEGMGQDVFVVDPFGVAKVEEKYRARFNQLDALDVTAPDFTTKLKAVAVALMPLAKNESDGGIWTKVGRRLLMDLISHVLTDQDFEGRRNLVTVRELLTRGDYAMYRLLTENGENLDVSPMDLLWESMKRNPALDGVISAAGHRYAANAKNNPKRNEDIRLNAIEETDFLDAKQFQDVLCDSDFRFEDLKTSPKGMTVYLCLPFSEISSYYPWLRVMVTLALAAVQQEDSVPANGHRTLFCLDEFASLQEMQPVKDAMAQIAGYHVTLFLVLQGLEQLEDIYGKGWEVFTTNCGLQLYFGVGSRTAEHLSKKMGEVEVIRSAEAWSSSTAEGTTSTETTSRASTTGSSRTRSRSLTETEAVNMNRTLTHSTNVSETTSSTVTEQTGTSHGVSRSTSRGGGTSDQWSENWNRTKGTHQGESVGVQSGWNTGTSGGSSKAESWARPGHGILGDVAKYIPWVREQETVNYQAQDGWSKGRSGGSNHGVSSGSSDSVGTGGSRGGGRNTTWSDGESESTTASRSSSEASGHSSTAGSSDGQSLSEGTSRSTGTTDSVSEAEQESETLTTGTSEGTSSTKTETTSRNESVHKRPLMTADEIEVYLGREDEKSRPGEAAWALILLKGHRPAVVHRSPYFRDIGFRWLFDPDPNHKAPPKLLGPLSVSVPPVARLDWRGFDCSIEWCVEPGQAVERGETLLTIEAPGPGALLSTEFLEEWECSIRVPLRALCGSGDVAAKRVRIPVFASVSGKLETQDLSRLEEMDSAVLIGNRRQHEQAEYEEVADPMAEYLKYLAELQEQQNAAEANEREDRIRAIERERENEVWAAKELADVERAAAREADEEQLEADYLQARARLDSEACLSWWRSQRGDQWFGVCVVVVVCAVFPCLGVWIIRNDPFWSFFTVLFGPNFLLAPYFCFIWASEENRLDEVKDCLTLPFSRTARERKWESMTEWRRRQYLDPLIVKLLGREVEHVRP